MTKFVRNLRYRLFYGLLLSRRHEIKTLGDPAGICQWNICPKGLGPKSIVYSGGLGSDITFEHDLVKQFGCELVLFDPSPTGRDTMSLPQNRLPQFNFFPVALAAKKGTLRMLSPSEGGDSWTPKNNTTEGLEVACTDLKSLMDENGHTLIDLLKLDIEGNEYEVIEDLLKRRVPVRQICVEYHHGLLPGISRGRTIRSMLRLARRGYKLVDQSGHNHTFIRPG
jgi:FkbM family methyltransferase